jgi:hypothetical protein
MARAFLAAVMAWAARESRARRVTLPTGTVDATSCVGLRPEGRIEGVRSDHYGDDRVF